MAGSPEVEVNVVKDALLASPETIVAKRRKIRENTFEMKRELEAIPWEN
jgi:hypothetical protein